MRVRVLGPIEVRGTADGPWLRPPPQQRQVLAALVSADGHARDASTLVEAVWGDEPPATAHRLLQALISRLRAALGQDTEDGPLQTVERGWRLALATDELDATRFDGAVGRARGLAENGDLDAARQVLDDALRLWRGEPFGELAGSHLIAAEGTRLEERRLEALQLHLQLQLEAGAHTSVIAELKELLAEHPTREHLWALLIVALYQAGRQAEALLTYQRVRERLVDELGVEPGPALQRLHQAVLQHQLDGDVLAQALGSGIASGGTAHRTAAVRTLPRPLTSFVGRRDELAGLTVLLTEARLVTIVGTGGVGKTRLAVAVAEAATPDTELGVAYVDLSRAEPELLVRAVAKAVGALAEDDEPLLDTVRAALRRGSSLLVLDNCERLLGPVSSLVLDLLDTCPELVVLVTSRERLGVPGERVFPVEPLPVDRATPPDTLDLSDAAADAVQLFLDRIGGEIGRDEGTMRQVQEICQRLDGLPLAIELAAARAASLGTAGLLAGLDDRLRLLDASPGSTGRHRSLRAVLDWSHELLDDQERAAFRRLAVFSAGFDLGAATSVLVAPAGGEGAEPQPSAVAHVVGRLVDKSLLLPAHGPDGSRWRWLDSVRAYALARLEASGEWQEHHRRHVAWAASTAEEIRQLMVAGGDWRTRFRAVEEDLLEALAAAGPPGGGGATPSLSDVWQQLALAMALAELQSRSGSYDVAHTAYTRAVTLARLHGTPSDLAQAALGASVSGMTFGVSDRQRLAWLEEALDAIGEGPSDIRVRLLSRLSMELYWVVDRQRSLERVEEAVAMAEQLGEDAALAHALHAQHYLHHGPGGPDRRSELSARVVRHAERGGVADVALAARAAHVVDLLRVGDLDGMDAALVVLRRDADRLGVPAYQWYADVYGLVRALMEGRYADADTLGATAIAAGRNVGEFTVGLSFASWVADLRDLDPAARRGRAGRLADLGRRFPGVIVWRCLALLDELALRHPAPRGVMAPPFTVPYPGSATDLVDAAEQLADDVLGDVRDPHWLVELSILSDAVAELGAVGVAGRLADALEGQGERLAVAGRVGACRGSVAHALGRLCVTRGDHDAAVQHLHAAVEQHERLGMLPHTVRSLTALADVHDRRGATGDRAAAVEVRRRADELARLLTGAAGGRPGPHDRAPGSGAPPPGSQPVRTRRADGGPGPTTPG